MSTNDASPADSAGDDGMSERQRANRRLSACANAIAERQRGDGMSGAAATVAVLPRWPQRTVAVLSTVDEGVHAIPVSAPVRAGDRRILLSLHRSRDTLVRIRRWPEVALTFLAEDDLAFTARGRATVVEEPMAVDPEYVAVMIEVAHVDDHRQPAFRVTAGIDREWVDEAARACLAARVRALNGA